MLKRYVQTRAQARMLDYNWLGEQPEDRWWEKYRAHSFLEHRTVIVEGRDDRWRLYASGIPSARRDAVGSDISHTIMLEGTFDPDAKSDAYRVLRAALLEPEKLGHVIDGRLDEKFVVRCLSEPDSRASEVAERIGQAIAGLPPGDQPVTPEPMRRGEVAWGGAESQEGPNRLLARAASLIEGEVTGVAAFLNLVRAPDLPKDLARDGAAAFLVKDSTEPWSVLPKASPHQLLPRAAKHRVLVSLAWAVVALVAAGLVAYLIYRNRS